VPAGLPALMTAAPPRCDYTGVTIAQDWSVLLGVAVRSLERRPPGELAYLTATSKVEAPVRDAVAFALHERLWPDGYVIAREFPMDPREPVQPGTARSRCDIAVLPPGGPHVLPVAEVEAKVLYGCNVMSPGGCAGYLGQHKRDADKLASSPAAGFLLSLVTHPMARIPDRLFSVVKYPNAHNRAVTRLGSAEELYVAARQKWLKELRALWSAAVHLADLQLGPVYGVAFTLGCYLVGPLADVNR
jgi:hypothetical protein